MNKTRLLLLADALETRVPADHFDLREWRADGAYHYVSDADLLNEECGTVACAVGWACALPEFQADGLSFKHGQPHFGNAVHFSAVNRFFDISTVGSHHLFQHSSYPDDGKGATPHLVAARIRAFVESHGENPA